MRNLPRQRKCRGDPPAFDYPSFPGDLFHEAELTVRSQMPRLAATVVSAKRISEYLIALALASFDASRVITHKSKRDWELLFPVPLSGFNSERTGFIAYGSNGSIFGILSLNELVKLESSQLPCALRCAQKCGRSRWCYQVCRWCTHRHTDLMRRCRQRRGCQCKPVPHRIQQLACRG